MPWQIESIGLVLLEATVNNAFQSHASIQRSVD
jgi:hypothetical protein